MFVDVALPLYVENFYTYFVPENFRDDMNLGIRVVVQFGKSNIYTGVVVNIHDKKPENYEVKPILDLMEKTPSVTKMQIKHWKWISDYYMCSFGEVLNVGMASGLKIESTTNIMIQDFDRYLLDGSELEIYNFLSVKGTNNIRDVIKEKGKNVIGIIKKLLEKGAILVYEQLKHRYKPKLEKYLVLNPKVNNQSYLEDILDKLSKYPKQKEVLLKLLTIKKDEIRYRDIVNSNYSYSNILKKLDEKNIIEIYETEVSRFKTEDVQKIELKLTEEQNEAYLKIKEFFLEKDITLLHGVTSSGKTEVYIKLIEDVLKEDKQVLYLLPEIAITTQIINRLRKKFGNIVGVYHSKYNVNERTEVWNRTLKNEYKILVGARSSIFLPFQSLGLVIIDEEHDTSFKQKEPNPRYSAKSSAIILAKIFKSKVLLGSATPSLESYYKSQRGDYGFVELKKRYLDIKLPEINIVDVRPHYRKMKMKGHFSPDLLKEIDNSLNNKNQIIIFQNRRGYFPYLECRDCGHILKCKKCDVSLTYHKGQKILKCHYCGYMESFPDKCIACGNISLENRGFGTEKIEDELKYLYPKSKIFRMDLDTTSKKYSYEKILEKFENREIDILVGTQMVTKGLNFENVSLVGVLNADNLLFYPDFRAHERAFQTLIQVSGRAGRKDKQGKVIIQTSNPENQILKQTSSYSFDEMYENQIFERQEFKYPPFVRIIEIYLKHKDLDFLNYATDIFSDSLRHIFKENLLGPVFPMVSKIKNLYIKKITIKIPNKGNLNNYKNMIKDIKENFLLCDKKFRNIKIVIDVDPF